MGIKFEFLKAGKGDCTLITVDKGTDKEVNILIDGGVSETYDDTKNKSRTLRAKLKEIQSLDLVVLTHIDNDHICGLIKLVEDDTHRHKIKELWFNSSDYIQVNISSEEKGYGESNYFKNLMNELKEEYPHFKYRDDVFMENKTQYLYGNIELTLLSPYHEQLVNLSKKQKEWNEKRIKKGQKIIRFCGSKGVKEVSRTTSNTTKKETEKNASSIAFILSYKNKNFLFLADADIKIVNESLKLLDKDLLKFEFIKLSHHGSKNNINPEFLNLTNTNKYVILTDGQSYNHPNKETIQLILEHKDKSKNVDFIFNYEEYFWEKFDGFLQENYNYKAYFEREIEL